MAEAKSPNLTLYRGWDGSGAYVWSPFVTKVEARLRLAGVEYKTDGGSMSKAPRGKIPYVSIQNTGSEPTLLADSTLIIEHFVRADILEDLDAGLSPTEKAHDLALRALLEDKLYFYTTHEKWIMNYYTMRAHVLSHMPYPMQVVVGLLAYRKVSPTLHGQGTSRFSSDEIAEFRNGIWDAVEGLLQASRGKQSDIPSDGSSQKPFWVLGGMGPTEADAVLFGFVIGAIIATAGPDSQKKIRSLDAAMDYAGRIHDAYFPDYERWV